MHLLHRAGLNTVTEKLCKQKYVLKFYFEYRNMKIWILIHETHTLSWHQQSLSGSVVENLNGIDATDVELDSRRENYRITT